MRHTPLILLLLIVLTAILSWLGSVYDWGLHSLLDAEGLRWMLTHVIDNVRQSPWVEIVMGLCSLSVLSESGLLQVFTPCFWRRSQRSLKKMRALQVTAVCFVFLVLCTLYFVLMPTSPLLSAFGRFSQSPLYYGFYSLSLIVVTLLSVIYGYTSGRFLTLVEVAQAMVYVPVALAEYFITIFFAAQFVACLHYALGVPLPTLGQLLTDGVPESAPLTTAADLLLFFIVYFIPLITSVFVKFVKR